MNWEQQRAQILATIKSKKGKIKGIMSKALGDNRSPSDAEEADIAAEEADIKKLEANLKRVENIIAESKQAEQTATPVAGQTQEQADATAEGDPEPEKAGQPVVVKSNLKKGLGFAMAMRARTAAQAELRKGNNVSAIDIAKSNGAPESVIRFLQKGVIMTTTEPKVAALIEEENLDGEFIELLRERTIFNKLKGFREVPFNTSMVNQTGAAEAYWVGEGQLKPTTDASFGTVKIGEHKIAAIEVFTDEFLRNAKPKSDQIFLDDLLAAAALKIDTTFIGDSAGTDVSPAGILHGVTGITATGTTAEAFDTDIEKLVAQFLLANKSLAGAQFIMTEIMAYKFAKLRDALGGKYYPEMQGGINEKNLESVGVIESENANNRIVLLKPSEILLADDEDVEVSNSNQATLEINGEQVNLWQRNMSAVRVERFITWEKRRPNAALYIQYPTTP